MNLLIDLKRKDGKEIKAEFKILDIGYINEIMKLQDKVLGLLEDKNICAPTYDYEFRDYILNKGILIGCVTLDSNELIAIGSYAKLGYEENNYGYDIDLKGEELLKVGQLESTLVREDYRGNKLQKIICGILEKIGLENGTPIICATVSPDNKYSMNTFKELGYRVLKEKEKYGGLRRYILVKEL
ncbi:MAG: GNAT family N-acetyltransferase [Clostridium sp.]